MIHISRTVNWFDSWSRRFFWIYEAALALLALVVVWLLTLPEEGWVSAANWSIWGVFAIDYVVRFAVAPNRASFFKSHIPEFLAALPLEPFRVFRLIRLTRLLRAGAVLWRVTRNVRRVLNTNGLAYVLMATSAFIVVGAAAIHIVEPDLGSYGDALWWAVVTATTVGYGDLSPSEPLGRVIAFCLMMVGIGTIGMITGSIATYFIRRKNEVLDPDVEYVRERLSSWTDLSADQRQQLAQILQLIAARRGDTSSSA